MARLARLEIPLDEEDALVDDLGRIVEWFERLPADADEGGPCGEAEAARVAPEKGSAPGRTDPGVLDGAPRREGDWVLSPPVSTIGESSQE